ncbi:MAG: hypothetical protein VW082_06845, partial [Candidatus Nanopelagicales bacterium]
MPHEPREGRPRARGRRSSGGAITGILVAAALVLSGVGGYVVGSATSAPSAVAAAMPTPVATIVTPQPVTPTPTPTATDAGTNAPFDV